MDNVVRTAVGIIILEGARGEQLGKFDVIDDIYKKSFEFCKFCNSVELAIVSCTSFDSLKRVTLT